MTKGKNMPSPTGTISGPNEPGPYAFGDTVTFTTGVTGLKGNQYALVYLEAVSVVDGEVLYGQLDLPSTPFLLGGGSSPWHDQRDDVHCTAYLKVYGGKDKGHDVILDLAAVTFDAAG